MVLVEWADSVIIEARWTPKKEAVQDAKRAVKEPYLTCGFLLKEADTHLILALSFDQVTGNVNQTMAIPKSAVLRKVELSTGTS